jgi:hypothetical protein
VTLAERKSKSQWMLCLFNDIIVPAKLQRYASDARHARHDTTHTTRRALTFPRVVTRGEIIPQLTVPLPLTWLHTDVKGNSPGALRLASSRLN